MAIYVTGDVHGRAEYGASRFAFRSWPLGLKPMKRTIKVITEANPDLSFAIIVNNFAANQTVDRQFLELLEADDLPVLGTVPTAAAFKQGAALGKPVYEIAKNGKAAQAIENILNELEEVL